MDVNKIDHKFQKYNKEYVEEFIGNLGFNVNNYFIAMTKPSMLSRALIGNIMDFSNRFCIVCFAEGGLNLIMLSRMDNKKVVEIIKIDRSEINDVKVSNILISYMLKLKTTDSTFNFQLLKVVRGFDNFSNSIELFKSMYQ